MNKRIEQLIESCTYVDSIGVDETVYYSFDKEKFAELIVRDTLDQVAEFGRLTRAYQTQGIDPEIDVTREVLKNFGFTRYPRS
jgi:uncharacterized ferritin-like protein (DUF455 family)